ncbi:MAG: hypothetical protein QW379_02115 [Thermoplasmata archaeon]
MVTLRHLVLDLMLSYRHRPARLMVSPLPEELYRHPVLLGWNGGDDRAGIVVFEMVVVESALEKCTIQKNSLHTFALF